MLALEDGAGGAEHDEAPDSWKSTCYAGFVTFLSVAPCAAATAVFTSFLTTLGPWMYEGLAQPHQTYTAKLIRTSLFSYGWMLLVLVYLLDIHNWQKCSKLFFVISAFAVLAFTVGLYFMSAEMPTIPLIVGVVLTMVVTRSLRWMCFKSIGMNNYMRGVSRAFFIIAVGLVAVWVVWLSSPEGLHGRAAWSNETSILLNGLDEESSLSMEAVFVLWCSPAILAIAFSIVSVMTWARSKLRPEEAITHWELKSVLAALAFLSFCVWIAASLAAADMEASLIVLRLTGVTFVLIIIWLAEWIGFSKIKEIAQHNSAMQMVIGLLMSDWVKGVGALLLLPILPFFFALEAVKQCLRRCLRKCTLLPEEEDNKVLTHKATCLWEWIADQEHCNLASILTKSMYWGIGIYVLQVGVSLGLMIFLSWFNEVMVPWSLESLLVVLFLVEIALFLFPPVAGPPLYMLAAIGIVPKVGMDRFWVGIAVSSLFCWFLKLFAVFAEQKAIGSVFSKSVAVKKFINIQTPFMKGVRCILSEPGCRLSKVAVLVGGPDWPTSVITGIMDLPLLPMLIGSLPVVILIVPCCISAAFLLKAGEDSENYNQHMAVADVSLLLATMCTAASNMLAAYFVQNVVAENQEEMDKKDSTWQKDPDEDQVLAAIEADAKYNEEYRKLTSWQVTPCAVKVVLVLGSLSATTTVAILLNPVSKAFRKFNLTDKVSELPNQSVLDVVYTAGYASLISLAITCWFLFIYCAWCACKTWNMGSSKQNIEDV